MASIKNEIIGIIFIFISITISCIFNWKQIHFIQWIIAMYYQMAMNYMEMILCASKLHVLNLVLIFCPDSTNAAKYNYDEYHVKLMQ